VDLSIMASFFFKSIWASRRATAVSCSIHNAFFIPFHNAFFIP
jgi:hypothetical protein